MRHDPIEPRAGTHSSSRMTATASVLLVAALLVGCGGSASSKDVPGTDAGTDTTADAGTQDTGAMSDASGDVPRGPGDDGAPEAAETVDVQAEEVVATDLHPEAYPDFVEEVPGILDTLDPGDDSGTVDAVEAGPTLDTVGPDESVTSCASDADCEHGVAWCEGGACVACDNSGLACFLACPDGTALHERNGCHPCECKAVNECASDGECGPGFTCIPGEDCLGWCPAGLASCCHGNRCGFVGSSCGTDADCTNSVCADGLCISYPCTPFVAGSGCGAGQWCLPDLSVSGSGWCIASVPDGLPDGVGCSTKELYGECADLALCLDGLCRRLCDPKAAAADPGFCPQPGEGRRGCSALAYDGGLGGTVKLAVGVCEAACVYSHSPGGAFEPVVPCADPDDVCQPGMVGGLAWDPCFPYGDDGYPLDEFDPCPGGGDYSYCRPGGICLDMGGSGSLQCRELCSGDVPPGFDQSNHPDCTRADAVCVPLSGPASPLGVCT